MKMTLAEAAQYLGKSQRQLRYLLRTGALKGAKVGGHWTFEQAELPVSPERQQARAKRSADLRATVDEALAPRLRGPGKRGYSVVDLTAFRTGVDCSRSCGQRLGEQAAAAIALRASVVALAQGCHRYHQRDKADAFRQAREHAAEAVALLHVEASPAALAIADTVEQQYLASLVGLLRHQERRDRS